MMEWIIALAVLSAAVFAVPLRAKWWTTLAVVCAGAAIASAEAVSVLANGACAQFPGFSNIVFGSGFGTADALSAVFLLIVSWAGVAVTVYARGYLKGYLDRKQPVQISLHYFALAAMFFSMLLVVLFRDGFGFLFSWEAMTIASFVLILFDAERKEVRRAALNYLVLMHVGFVFLLIGFVTVGAEGLPVSFDSLGPYFARRGALPLFAIFLVGFGMKAGMFPLHVWLPEAHPAAPSHVSAFMSGVMIKMGVYGIMRVCSYLSDDFYAVGAILFAAGIATGLWGVILAALQNDMKKMLAYSSIENIGIVFIGLGFGLIGRSGYDSLLALCGFGGALLHTINHSFFKTLLFMGAGNVYASIHTVSLDRLGGLGKRMPVTSLLFLVGSLAICALPPFNGFVSEFMIYLGLFDGLAGNDAFTLLSLGGVIALALIGGLAVLVFAKLYGMAFLGVPRSEKASAVHEADRSMFAGMAFPLAGILLVGFGSYLAVPFVSGVAAETFGLESDLLSGMVSDSFVGLTVASAVLVLAVVLIGWLRRIALRRRTVEEGPVWGCGFPAQSARIQYTGESFSEGWQRLTRKMTQNVGDDDKIGSDEIFPVSHNFEVKHRDKLDSLFSVWWVALIRRLNARFSALRTGKVNHYILYALLFFVLIFLLSVLKMIR